MLEFVSHALLEKLEESNECKNVRCEILNEQLDFNEDEYDLASHILNETSEKYFHLGFKSCLSMIFDLLTQ